MEADSQATFATADGIAVGTVDYMSPEQACGRDVDGRSDLFSLGCSMYHLITGRLPFPGDSPDRAPGQADQRAPRADHRRPARPAVEPRPASSTSSWPTSPRSVPERRRGGRGAPGADASPGQRRSPPKEPDPPAPPRAGSPAGHGDGAAGVSRLVPPAGRAGRGRIPGRRCSRSWAWRWPSSRSGSSWRGSWCDPGRFSPTAVQPIGEDRSLVRLSIGLPRSRRIEGSDVPREGEGDRGGP